MSNVIELFHSNLNLYEVSNITGMHQKKIRNIWNEFFGKSKVRERGKGRNKKPFGQDLIDEFYNFKSLRVLSKEYSVDCRTITKNWIHIFGEQKVKNRKIVINKDQKVIDKIYGLINNGLGFKEICKKVSIPKSTIIKYIKLDEIVYKKYLNNNKIIKSKKMKIMRSGKSISKECEKRILEYFDTDLFPYEIAKKFSLHPNSIRNIFKKKENYKERCERLKNKRLKRSLVALEKAGKLGSKGEISFYNQLNERLNIKIKHHDYDLLPPYEIDITIPDLKIAICWDGIGHFKPIFGEKNFNKVFHRDKFKRRKLKAMGWFVFVVKDLVSHYNDNFFKQQNDRFDRFLKKIGYGDYIVSTY